MILYFAFTRLKIFFWVICTTEMWQAPFNSWGWSCYFKHQMLNFIGSRFSLLHTFQNFRHENGHTCYTPNPQTENYCQVLPPHCRLLLMHLIQLLWWWKVLSNHSWLTAGFQVKRASEVVCISCLPIMTLVFLGDLPPNTNQSWYSLASKIWHVKTRLDYSGQGATSCTVYSFILQSFWQVTEYRELFVAWATSEQLVSWTLLAIQALTGTTSCFVCRENMFLSGNEKPYCPFNQQIFTTQFSLQRWQSAFQPAAVEMWVYQWISWEGGEKVVLGQIYREQAESKWHCYYLRTRLGPVGGCMDLGDKASINHSDPFSPGARLSSSGALQQPWVTGIP